MSTEIKVPYVLVCRVTGLQKAYTSKEFVARKIENYGGNEQAMIDGYVCKEAKRLLKPYGENVTEADIAKVITELKGTTNAKDVLALVQGGKLFLTKKVKVRAKADGEVKAAAASKKGRTAKKAKMPKAAKAKPAAKKSTAKKSTRKKASKVKHHEAAPAAAAPAEASESNTEAAAS